MSVNLSLVLREPHTETVAPTETTLDAFTRLDLRTTRRISIQVYNEDAAQTFSGIVYVKQEGMTDFAVLDDVTLIVGPLTSKYINIDTELVDAVELRGTMSGAGGDVQTGTMKAAP